MFRPCLRYASTVFDCTRLCSILLDCARFCSTVLDCARLCSTVFAALDRARGIFPICARPKPLSRLFFFGRALTCTRCENSKHKMSTPTRVLRSSLLAKRAREPPFYCDQLGETFVQYNLYNFEKKNKNRGQFNWSLYSLFY